MKILIKLTVVVLIFVLTSCASLELDYNFNIDSTNKSNWVRQEESNSFNYSKDSLNIEVMVGPHSEQLTTGFIYLPIIPIRFSSLFLINHNIRISIKPNQNLNELYKNVFIKLNKRIYKIDSVDHVTNNKIDNPYELDFYMHTDFTYIYSMEIIFDKKLFIDQNIRVPNLVLIKNEKLIYKELEVLH